MTKTTILLLGIILLTAAALTTTTTTRAASAIPWSCTLTATENTTNHGDTATFGEAADANDGLPPDHYDIAVPPPPFTPYLRLTFSDHLPIPYTQLWKDYRHGPDTDKTWNLTIQWIPADYASPTTVTLTWNPANLTNTEYKNITLCTMNGTVLQNMRTQSSYSFPCPAIKPQLYTIVCNGGTTGGGGGGNGGGGTSENQPPTAFITTQTIDIVNVTVTFDATHSYDPDGHITSYAWDFGDTTTGTGPITNHTYHTTGNYIVHLTVTDNGGKTGTYNTTIQIITVNQPPARPSIIGPSEGTKRHAYTFSITSIDTENYPLQYTVNWGDGTHNTSDFLADRTPYIISHTWTFAGRYTITATATDNINLSSPGEATVYINVTFLGSLGCLYDANDDGILDTFYSNTSRTTTPVHRLADGTYTFTANGTYFYNPASGTFTLQEPQTTAAGFPWLLLIAAIVVLAVVFLVVLLYTKKRQ